MSILHYTLYIIHYTLYTIHTAPYHINLPFNKSPSVLYLSGSFPAGSSSTLDFTLEQRFTVEPEYTNSSR